MMHVKNRTPETIAEAVAKSGILLFAFLVYVFNTISNILDYAEDVRVESHLQQITLNIVDIYALEIINISM